MASYERQSDQIVEQVGYKAEYESTNVRKYLQDVEIHSLCFVMTVNCDFHMLTFRISWSKLY